MVTYTAQEIVHQGGTVHMVGPVRYTFANAIGRIGGYDDGIVDAGLVMTTLLVALAV